MTETANPALRVGRILLCVRLLSAGNDAKVVAPARLSRKPNRILKNRSTGAGTHGADK
jgi:hypothetical protein